MAGMSFIQVMEEFREAARRRMDNTKNLDNYDLRKLMDDLPALEEIQQALARQGHTSFEYIGNGQDAIAFRTNTGDVIRLDSLEGDRLQRQSSRFMLQAQSVLTFSDYKIRIEVTPYAESLHSFVERGALSREDARGIFDRFRSELLKKGLVAQDLVGVGGAMRWDQIGLLADGTPLIIDPGCKVARISDYKKGLREYLGLEKIAEYGQQVPAHIAAQRWNWPHRGFRAAKVVVVGRKQPSRNGIFLFRLLFRAKP